MKASYNALTVDNGTLVCRVGWRLSGFSPDSYRIGE